MLSSQMPNQADNLPRIPTDGWGCNTESTPRSGQFSAWHISSFCLSTCYIFAYYYV